MAPVKLILVDINVEMINAWKDWIDKYNFNPEILPEVAHKSFVLLKDYDCMVSAANSFGLMDGGVDLAIASYFGEKLVQRVQKTVLEKWHGEQPVGTSEIIAIPNWPKEGPRYIAHTPTMRTPKNLAVSYPDTPYVSMWAMLNAVAQHNLKNKVYPKALIETIVCPGLGTLTGGILPDEGARQMLLAWKNFHEVPTEITWAYALRREQEVDKWIIHESARY